MQNFIWQPKHSNYRVKDQLCHMLSLQLPFTHETRDEANIPKQPFNACHNSIVPITQGQVSHKID